VKDEPKGYPIQETIGESFYFARLGVWEPDRSYYEFEILVRADSRAEADHCAACLTLLFKNCNPAADAILTRLVNPTPDKPALYVSLEGAIRWAFSGTKPAHVPYLTQVSKSNDASR